MVRKAQRKILDINQQTIFQKAQIRKENIKKMQKSSEKLKNFFTESNHFFLNNSLSNTLLKVNEDALNLKNQLLKDLKEEIIKSIKDNIKKNYDNYLKYLYGSYEKNKILLHNSNLNTIILNNSDYDYFSKGMGEIFNNLGKKEILQKSENDFIGGFLISQYAGKIIYDFTIDNSIQENILLIEKEFSNVFSDITLTEIEKRFNQFVKNQKIKLKEELRNYDKI